MQSPLETYGVCPNCNSPRTAEEWCRRCCSAQLQELFGKWTSGHEQIDEFIQESHINASDCCTFLEWIPTTKLQGVKDISRKRERNREVGSVYTGIWMDGPKLSASFNKENGKYAIHRAGPVRVALKTLEVESGYLDELRAHYQCASLGERGLIGLYGVAQHPETNQYLIVMQFAQEGDLRKYLETHHASLSWRGKLNIIRSVSYDLCTIHTAGLIHNNLHTANVLVKGGGFFFVGDLKFSQPVGEVPIGSTEKGMFGVVPFMAPEVLRGEGTSQLSDTYSLGIVMAEIATGMIPFADRPHDDQLKTEICNGLKPVIGDRGFPLYDNLVYSCLDGDPRKRPSAREVYQTVTNWYDQLGSPEDSEVRAQVDAAGLSKSSLEEQTEEASIHPDAVYFSRFINYLPAN